MDKVQIPNSIDTAIERLNGIEQLLTARGWERAAIVAAFVELSPNQAHAKSRMRMGTVEFAALGVAGLTTADTVRRYAKAWLDNYDGIHPRPGATVTLPSMPFPPESANLGTRTTATSIGRQMSANPALAKAAAAELSQPGGAVEHLNEDEAARLGVSAAVRANRDRARELSGDPHRRLSDQGKSKQQLADDEYWRRVRAAIQLLLDVKIKIRDGVEPPADVIILMQILVPETDWDQALLDELGHLS